MDIYIKQKNGATLQTEKKYCNENIQIIPETENIEINPSIQEQIFISEKVGYNQVKVKRVTSNIDENIKSENIKEGVSILGVEGGYKSIETSDATAIASDILENKTAYVNGQKITGNIKNNGELNFVPSANLQQIPKGYTSGGHIEPVDITVLQDYQICERLADTILTGEGV